MKILYVALLGLLGAVSKGAEYSPGTGPDREEIWVHCGDVSLLLRRKTQWTPGRFDFRKVAMTTHRSAYGTVFNYRGTGFIGTGHFENEPEELQEVRFFMDGQRVDQPEQKLVGETFRFERVSKIRDFSLKNWIELRNGRIYETTSIATKVEVPLKLVYNFMHAWKPSVTQFVAGRDDDPDNPVSGLFRNDPEKDRGFHISKSVDWVGVYEPESRQFAVSRILKSPEGVKEISMIWNVPGTYRKYYHTSFQNTSVPAGFSGTWKMVTAFGTAEPEQFQAAARKLAGALRD
ncbi:MAG: hypothetical protein P1V20_18335 [Verrucomicrobiales bacterium]|nr:hypothetical protein [Verrucomicrobiales bacterium]